MLQICGSPKLDDLEESDFDPPNPSSQIGGFWLFKSSKIDVLPLNLWSAKGFDIILINYITHDSKRDTPYRDHQYFDLYILFILSLSLSLSFFMYYVSICLF